MICHNTFVSCGEEVETCYTSKKKNRSSALCFNKWDQDARL